LEFGFSNQLTIIYTTADRLIAAERTPEHYVFVVIIITIIIISSGIIKSQPQLPSPYRSTQNPVQAITGVKSQVGMCSMQLTNQLIS
jgi:hypothetical protein